MLGINNTLIVVPVALIFIIIAFQAGYNTAKSTAALSRLRKQRGAEYQTDILSGKALPDVAAMRSARQADADDFAVTMQSIMQHLIDDAAQAHREVEGVSRAQARTLEQAKALLSKLQKMNKHTTGQDESIEDIHSMMSQLRDMLHKKTHTFHDQDPEVNEDDDDRTGVITQGEEDNFGFDDSVYPGQIRVSRNMDCLDGYDDDRLITYYCSRRQNRQIWSFKGGRIQTADNRCIDAADVGKGGVLTLTECDVTPSQKFRLRPMQDHVWNVSTYIVSEQTGLCITAPSPYAEDMASVRLEDCGMRKCSQLWFVNAFAIDVDAAKAVGNAPTVLQHLNKEALAVNPNLPVLQAADRGGHEIFCWVMTNPKNHATKARAVQNTWGRHCDKLVFVTTQPDDGLPTWIVKLPLQESRDMLWDKSKQAWMRTYEEELSNFQWFIRADDDTYLMMDNLGAFLKVFDPQEEHYFGRKFDGRVLGAVVPFYSGGSGTILSQGALRKLGDSVRTDPSLLSTIQTCADDMELGMLMTKLGIAPVSLRDSTGAQLFIALGLDSERSITRKDDPNNWFFSYSPEAKEGVGCCSEHWIGTHYVTAEGMYMYDDIHLLGCEAAGPMNL